MPITFTLTLYLNDGEENGTPQKGVPPSLRSKRKGDKIRMEDKNIIELFWQRSQDAIENTAQKYGNYLMKIAMNILSHFEESEECVNDTYLTAWNQMPPDKPRELRAYLGRITRCLALNRFDYLKAGKRSADFSLQLSELEECLSGNNTPEEEYESGEIAKAISEFLYTVKKDARCIFVRRYWYSDSISDIARLYGMKENSVKSILSRTRVKLKKYLESEGYKL